MQSLRFISIGLAILSFGIMMTAWAQTAPSPADLGKLITQDAEVIKTSLAKPKVDKKAQSKIRLAAFLIAHYAQSSIVKDSPKAGSLATLRDRALGIVKAVDDGKLDEAKKLAESLSPDVAADPGVKVAPVALEKHLDLESVMKAFSSVRMAGLGLENHMDDLANFTGPVEAADAEKIQASAQKIAMIALLANFYAPPKDAAKTKKLWTALNKEMYTTALELAEAAKTKQGAAISKIAQKLTTEKVGTVCTRCHDVFR